MFNFYYNCKKYTVLDVKLKRCPYKHCAGDKLGFLGGSTYAHRCYKHGIFLIKIGTSCEDSFVSTLEMLEPRSWTFEELLSRGVLELKLLDNMTKDVLCLPSVI